jgi:hypothetical protein
MPALSKLVKMSEMYQVSMDYLLKGEDTDSGVDIENENGVEELVATATGAAMEDVNSLEQESSREPEACQNGKIRRSGTWKVVVSAIAVAAIVIIAVAALILRHRQEPATTYMGTVVLDGFEISIPDKYAAAVYSDVGLSYFDSRTFEMGISVVDGSYDETLESLDDMSLQISDWFTLLEPFEEIQVEGGSYIYCVYEDEGETILLAYKAADSEHSFEVMVRCLEIDQLHFQTEAELETEYEAFITIADSLLGNARSTEEENTPAGTVFVSDHMYSDLQVEYPETFEAEDALYDDQENRLVGFQVPEGYYRYAQEYQPGRYSMKVYENLDENVVATLIVDDNPREKSDACTLLQEGAGRWTGGNQEVKSVEVSGHTFYYYTYTEPYTSMDEELEKYYFEAAVDLGDGRIYRVSGYSSDNEKAANPENYWSFFQITEP